MHDEQAVQAPPLTLNTAIEQARADERRRCIAFLRSEAERCGAASMGAVGPEAEVLAADSASFAAAAGLLAAWAGALRYAADPDGIGPAGIEVAKQARADERRRCGMFLRGWSASARQRGELVASNTASWLANELDPLGPVTGAPAAGGTT